MSEPVVRVFSDLHYGDPNSRLKKASSLAPLFEGADEIIFNGDTVDTLLPSLHARDYLDELRAVFTSSGAHVTLLSGNHDPDISDLAEQSLADGRVWITHGDVFFDDIAPWSRCRAEFRRRLDDLASRENPADLARVETRLRLHRLACMDLPEALLDSHKASAPRISRVASVIFPPTRFLAMLHAWRDLPRIAPGLARSQRPQARVVVAGHTHYPGVWHSSAPTPVTVINTGSFSRPFGALFVELQGGLVRVKRVAERGSSFHPGRTVAEFPLAD